MEKKNSKKILLAIMGVLIVVAIIARSLKFPTKPVSTIAYLISLVFTALYGFCFYKKPHGNMLKYAMIIFAVSTIVQCCNDMALDGKVNHQIIKVLACTAVCYCSGRLNRIDKNKYLMPIIGFVFFGTSVYNDVIHILDQSITLASAIRHFSYTINYVTLVIAYFVRYDEHKEAGLIDAPNK